MSRYLSYRFASELLADRLWEARAAVDFMINGIPGMSAAGLQRTLGQKRDLIQLLNNAAIANQEEAPSTLPTNTDGAWWLYAFKRVRATSEPVAAEIEEELFLSCQAADGNQSSDVSTLLQFSFDDGRWSEIYRRMSSLPM